MSPFAPRWGHASGSCCVCPRIPFDRQLFLKGLLIALSTLFVSGSTAHAQTVVAAPVVVRSYNTLGVPLAMLEHAESTAGDLLREAGIDASWRNCRTTDGPSLQSRDLCDEVLNASEVIVRIVRAPRAITDVEVLGYSHVDPYRRQGTLATVFADRVRALAAALRIDAGTLLGRAMTHEIGHLLLGTLDHSQEGLMRGHWSKDGRVADWFFSFTQAEQIRSALASRTASTPPAIALAQSAR
jgi:hypothetical protein